MKTTITFEIDETGRSLEGYTDRHIADLWHISQANPVPIENREAGEFAELVGREIIRRWVQALGPELWAHQGRHADWAALHLKPAADPALPSQGHPSERSE